MFLLFNIGSWGCWNNVGHCSTSCGNGTQLRVRHCDSPAPTNDGSYCPGNNVTHQWCNVGDCPGTAH